MSAASGSQLKPADTLDPSALLPFRVVVVTLQFTCSTTVRFFHQVPLCAMLRHLAQDNETAFSDFIRIDTVETGRIKYHSGDFYRFSIVCLAGGESILNTLLRQLQKLPQAVQLRDEKLPFRDNLALYSLQDAFTGAPVDATTDLSSYGVCELADEVRLWRRQASITLRWVAPVRLLRDKKDRENLRDEEKYCRDTRHLPATLLLARIRDSIASLLRKRDIRPPARQRLALVSDINSCLFWVDQDYVDRSGKEKSMGGASGEHLLDTLELGDENWRNLIVGQYVGVGQNTAFGWGRYQLVNNEQSVTYRRVFAAGSWLAGACQLDNLIEAYAHILANRPGADPQFAEDSDVDHWELEDDDPLPRVDDAVTATLERLSSRLQDGSYAPPALRGVVIDKPDGGVRPLAIAPFWDAVLQRAVASHLNPSLDSLMYPKSHGYRPGRSRLTARYDIERAWRDGYRWIYESDIEDFFDSVSHRDLAVRLRAMFGSDPVVDVIMQWMAAPVLYENRTIARSAGLPQGSPLSPLMANLMLDDFDSDMQAAGFCLVRFADDFVVLCKDPEQAQAASVRVAQSLADAGLRINTDKTRTVNSADGFRYLGYQFVNDMAVDLSGRKKPAQKKPAQKKPVSEVPPGSWLARIGTRMPEKLLRTDTLARQAADIMPDTQTLASEQQAQSGTLVVVAGAPSVVSTALGKLCITRKEKRLQEIPWETVQTILLFGHHQLTTQAMHRALERDIPVHLANGGGQYRGLLSSAKPARHGQLLWLRQLVVAQDHEQCAAIASELVGARMRHMHELMRKRDVSMPQTTSRYLRFLRRYKSLTDLNGAEGAVSREFFAAMKKLVPKEFGFRERNRRPPRDPFNALLSLGYTSLYGISESILRSNGLLPTVGFYHQPHGRHATLASDFMEPFRHVVEQTALTFINSKRVRPGDFKLADHGGCYVDARLRREYLARLIDRFERSISARGSSEKLPLFRHMDQQAKSLKRSLMGGEPFSAFRMR